MPIVVYIVIDYIIPVTWHKLKVKDTRPNLEKSNCCLSKSHFRNSLLQLLSEEKYNYGILSDVASLIKTSPHFYNGHATDIKRLIF